MTKQNIKRLSFLGFVLAIVSGVIAAIVPGKSSKAIDPQAVFSETQSFDAGGRGMTLTCEQTNVKTPGNTCTISVNTGTTGVGDGSSDATPQNTSDPT
jgi:hypothetical protein